MEGLTTYTLGSRQVVSHQTLTLAFAGSNPASPVLRLFPSSCVALPSLLSYVHLGTRLRRLVARLAGRKNSRTGLVVSLGEKILGGTREAVPSVRWLLYFLQRGGLRGFDLRIKRPKCTQGF